MKLINNRTARWNVLTHLHAVLMREKTGNCDKWIFFSLINTCFDGRDKDISI